MGNSASCFDPVREHPPYSWPKDHPGRAEAIAELKKNRRSVFSKPSKNAAANKADATSRAVDVNANPNADTDAAKNSDAPDARNDSMFEEGVRIAEKKRLEAANALGAADEGDASTPVPDDAPDADAPIPAQGDDDAAAAAAAAAATELAAREAAEAREKEAREAEEAEEKEAREAEEARAKEAEQALAAKEAEKKQAEEERLAREAEESRLAKEKEEEEEKLAEEARRLEEERKKAELDKQVEEELAKEAEEADGAEDEEEKDVTKEDETHVDSSTIDDRRAMFEKPDGEELPPAKDLKRDILDPVTNEYITLTEYRERLKMRAQGVVKERVEEFEGVEDLASQAKAKLAAIEDARNEAKLKTAWSFKGFWGKKNEDMEAQTSETNADETQTTEPSNNHVEGEEAAQAS